MENDKPHIQSGNFEQIADLIARVDVPRSKAGRAYDLLPSERPDTPENWISNYAEGMARGSETSHDQMIAGIRAAFENKYGMSPEAFAERYTPERTASNPGKEDAVRSAARQEAARDHDREDDHDISR